MSITDRFLKYVSFCTTSDDSTRMTPSTPGQMEFARFLVEELKQIGLQEVTLSDYGYVMATLPATTQEAKPVVGFIAHMDTSPDASGKNIHPSIKIAEDGPYKGQELIVTDGTTLLGADDKAGIAEIVCAMEYFIQHPELKHGKVRIAFTPDEEIGQGADHFDVQTFGADFAYTMDGGEIGELQYENFNAAAVTVTIHGVNVHPGSAYHKMINSMRIAYQFAVMLPRWQTPEHTQDYEGFYHLTHMSGTVEETTLHYIIRDHDAHLFESKKRELEHLVHKVNREYGEGTAEIAIRDQYYNMREKIEPVMWIVDLAQKAMREAGVEPKIKPIRGGTDGATLSYKGLPCPNIFAGGENFHSRFEFIPIHSMEKATEVIKKIITML